MFTSRSVVVQKSVEGGSQVMSPKRAFPRNPINIPTIRVEVEVATPTKTDLTHRASLLEGPRKGCGEGRSY